jgi:hypothetical protein
LFPTWRREELYLAKLENLRHLTENSHHPWYQKNPWGHGLRDGDLYRVENSKRVFRTVLQFDPNDFAKWERIQRENLQDRKNWRSSGPYVPVRREWMIEEVATTDDGWLMGRTVSDLKAVPGTRRTLDERTWRRLRLHWDRYSGWGSI